jgi:hypothetical protein
MLPFSSINLPCSSITTFFGFSYKIYYLKIFTSVFSFGLGILKPSEVFVNAEGYDLPCMFNFYLLVSLGSDDILFFNLIL